MYKRQLRDLNHKSEVLHEPVLLKGEADGIQVEAAFQYTNEFRENVLGFCNNIYNAEAVSYTQLVKKRRTAVLISASGPAFLRIANT